MHHYQGENWWYEDNEEIYWTKCQDKHQDIPVPAPVPEAFQIARWKQKKGGSLRSTWVKVRPGRDELAEVVRAKNGGVSDDDHHHVDHFNHHDQGDNEYDGWGIQIWC